MWNNSEAAVAEQPANTVARGDPGADTEAEHLEPNKAGEPEQQQNQTPLDPLEQSILNIQDGEWGS